MGGVPSLAVTDPVQLHVVDRGQGPTLLFVHGWLNDASVWGGVIEELSGDFRCIAVDLRGHGQSLSLIHI